MQVTTRAELGEALVQARAAYGDGILVGFVPTMGALHAGHSSLIKRAAQECEVVVVSIFVNPTQFGPGEDFERYPRTLDADLEAAYGAGADIVFLPEVGEMYPDLSMETAVDPGPLALRWEGVSRPGHFAGVAHIVLRFFDMVAPQKAYFGEKDYQQLCVLRQLVSDLGLPIEIVACPTVRDADGLALSSRNCYLSAKGRTAALTIPRALETARELAEAGETCAKVLEVAAHDALDARLVVDYLAVVDALTLEPCTEISDDFEARLILAVDNAGVRLIDNTSL